MSALIAFLLGLAVLAAFVVGVPLVLSAVAHGVQGIVTIWKTVLRL